MQNKKEKSKSTTCKILKKIKNKKQSYAIQKLNQSHAKKKKIKVSISHKNKKSSTYKNKKSKTITCSSKIKINHMQK